MIVFYVVNERAERKYRHPLPLSTAYSGFEYKLSWPREPTRSHLAASITDNPSKVLQAIRDKTKVEWINVLSENIKTNQYSSLSEVKVQSDSYK